MRVLRTELLAVTSLLALASCGGDKDIGPAPSTCQASDGTITAAIQAFEEVADETYEARDLDTTSCVDLMPTSTECTFEARVEDFEEGSFQPELGGTTVRVYPSNTIDDIDTPCELVGSGATDPTCWEATADNDGYVSVPGLECGRRFAIWAFRASDLVPVTKPAVEFDRVVAEGATNTQDVLTISVSTYQLIPGIVGFQPDPTLGIVAGKVSDCTGSRGLANVTTHIVAGLGGDVPEGGKVCGAEPIYRVGTFYFRDSFPTKEQTVTSEDGLWAFVNVPPGEVTVHAYGRTAAGGDLTALDSVGLASLPDTITIGDLQAR